MARKNSASADAPPWEKLNPKTKGKAGAKTGSKTSKKGSGAKSVKLTPAEKNEAKSRAKKAGRPYPNLVDNMQVTKEHKKRERKSN